MAKENISKEVKGKKIRNIILFIIMLILAIAFMSPIVVVLMNSFKGQFFISDTPFQLITKKTFVGIENYITGIEDTEFIKAFFLSLFITVFSVALIILFTSMTAWYITRVKNKLSEIIYFSFAFAMIVPFQMVMFTMSKVADFLRLNNPIGIIFIYLGFGAGLSVFMFAGFVKSIPLEIEEAAMIEGCTPVQTFFLVILPMLKSTAITVAILNAMWIWNDYLLPYLVIGSDYKTIPIAVQYLKGGYGSVNMGALMAMLILAIIPIVIFYVICQKHIIKGVLSGAVKG